MWRVEISQRLDGRKSWSLQVDNRYRLTGVHNFCILAYVLLSRKGVNSIFLNALWRRFSLILRAYFSILVSAVVFHGNFTTPHESQTEHLPKAYQFIHFPRLEAECHLKLRKRTGEPAGGGTVGIVSWCLASRCHALTYLPERKVQTSGASTNQKSNFAFQLNCWA